MEQTDVDGRPRAELDIVYVDGRNAVGPWDGRTWNTAFRTVQEGLDRAADIAGPVRDGDRAARDGSPALTPDMLAGAVIDKLARPVVHVEVWVAAGLYRPTDSGDRNASICLRPGVALYGGFCGDETTLADRDWRERETILSGAIGEDPKEYSFHVVVGAEDAVIDGFTIRDGNNIPEGPRPHHMSPGLLLDSRGRGTGAGILNDRCAPVVRNCLICDNRAAKGAGMYNMVTRSWPARRVEKAPVVIDCVFARNYSEGRGGAVSNDLETHPAFINCTFLDNRCDGKGGAVYNDFDCSPELINCVFARNEAMKGGAVANDGRSNPTITNCTFARNHARDMYGALYSGTGPTNVPNVPVVTNCIFWGNTADSGPSEIGNWHDCRTVVTYSCVQGGYEGEGNIDADPAFVDADAGDLRLRIGSPCVDAGHGGAAPPRDRDGNPRQDDPASPTGPKAVIPFFPEGSHLPEPSMEADFDPPVDMGAYERQPDPAWAEPEGILYVDAANIDGPWDGASWATAYADLQDALSEAYLHAAEIWVAEGVYRPTTTGDRRAAFRLKRGLTLYGGFGGGESGLEERDWTAHRTVLSGDLGGLGGGNGNSYHVVLGADGAALDGFVVTGGNADGEGFYSHGGGMLNYNACSPRVSHCTFVRNRAREGGGMYNYNLSAPLVRECEFLNNQAEKGGAMVNRVGASPDVAGCRFVQNSAEWRGGAVHIDYGSGPGFSDCLFEGNRSGGHGGGAFLESVAAQLGIVGTRFDGCTFRGNSAAQRGGAVANADASNPTLTGCVFENNQAGRGGGAIANDYFVTVTVEGCSFHANSGGTGADDVDTDASSEVVLGGRTEK